jgi:hypothetical protein
MKKSVNTYLRKAAEFESTSALWSEEELRSLLNNAATAVQPSNTENPTQSDKSIPQTASSSDTTTTIVELPKGTNPYLRNSVITGGIAAGLLWFTIKDNPKDIKEVNPITTKPRIQQTQIGSRSQADALLTNPLRSTQEAQKSKQLESGSSIALNEQSQEANSAQADYTTMSNERSAESSMYAINNLPTTESQRAGYELINGIKIPTSIQGIQAIELSDEQLKNLGVEKTSTGYSLTGVLTINPSETAPILAFMGAGTKRQTSITLSSEKLKTTAGRFGVDTSSNVLPINFSLILNEETSRAVMTKSDKNVDVFPLVVSQKMNSALNTENAKVYVFGNASGEQSQARYAEESAQLFSASGIRSSDNKQSVSLNEFPLMGKLVPVIIRIPNGKNPSNETLLWYYPDEQFLSKLPLAIAQEIREEIKRIKQREEESQTSPSGTLLQERLTGEYKYTEVARSRNGSIEILSVGPNPAQSQATLRLRTYSSRSINVVLYDMSGTKISVLESSSALSIGEHTIPLELANLPSGAYLISLISNQGEQAIERLIIQN